VIYLLDTNACIAILKDKNSPVATRLAVELPENAALCSVVKAELLYGAYKSQQSERTLKNLTEFFKPFASYSFDDAASVVYGQIRAALATRGTPIGPNDLMIAAIALSNDLTLITNNTREFSRVDNLQIEDWQHKVK